MLCNTKRSYSLGLGKVSSCFFFVSDTYFAQIGAPNRATDSVIDLRSLRLLVGRYIVSLAIKFVGFSTLALAFFILEQLCS